jgi:hypothetical protein
MITIIKQDASYSKLAETLINYKVNYNELFRDYFPVSLYFSL